MYNVRIFEAATRIESIQRGIGALGEMLQVVDLDSISDESIGRIGSMLVVLSEVTVEALNKMDSEASHA